jgi:hypothetical protein
VPVLTDEQNTVVLVEGHDAHGTGQLDDISLRGDASWHGYLVRAHRSDPS